MCLNSLKLWILCLLALDFCLSINMRSEVVIRANDYEVLKTYRRSPTYYTQGVFYSDDGNSLYESGGLYGESVLVKMDYPSLKIVKRLSLDGSFFAEGIAKCGDYL